MPSAERDLVFHSPRIGADLLMLALLLPIATAAVAFLVAFVAVPLVLWLGVHPDDWTLAALAWTSSFDRVDPRSLGDRGQPLFPAFTDPNAATSLEVVEFEEQTSTARPFKR